MQKIAQFFKISFNQFSLDFINSSENYKNYSKEKLETIYNSITLPKRATKGSAGYDFCLPHDLNLNPNETIIITTGIRVSIDDGWVLKCYPRSSLGFKFKLKLDNTVGIIDSDYFNAKNEGHIMAKITNNSDQILKLDEGSAFIQGVFVQYGITIDDDVEELRTGGFGSTN